MNSLWLSNVYECSAIVVLIAAHTVTLPVSAAPVPVQSFHKGADGVTLAMLPGKMKLTVCSDRIVRVMYSPTALLPEGQNFAVTNHSWPATPFRVADSRGKLTVSTRHLKVAVNKASGAVKFFDASGHLLLGEPADGGKTIAPVTVNGESSCQPEQTFVSPTDEFLYGLGQFQDGNWNWRGMPEQLHQLNTQISIPMGDAHRDMELASGHADQPDRV